MKSREDRVLFAFRGQGHSVDRLPRDAKQLQGKQNEADKDKPNKQDEEDDEHKR